MRFTEIGQQLRAYRMETGLRAEEIAARLGVSRAALYRYEKGEVIKLDTIQRLAELLKISPLSLLGIGVEYYNRPAGYFERIRQIEETADQILLVHQPICYLVTSAAYDSALTEALFEVADSAGAERGAMRSAAEQLLGLLAARKKTYQSRRPSIIAMVSASSIVRFLEGGIASALPLSERMRRICRDVAAAEIEQTAALMETEPMGLQFGLLQSGEPSSTFEVLRARDRANLAVNPFPSDTAPNAQSGVAMVTSADDAVGAHQRVAEANWRDVLKGAAAAAKLRELIAKTRAPA